MPDYSLTCINKGERCPICSICLDLCISNRGGCGADIVVFFSKDRCLSSLSLNHQTPTLLVPGVCNINVPSSSKQAWMLPGISVASPRQTTASPWNGGTARQPLTVTELSMHPSLEVTMPRSKCQGARKPQPKPRSRVSRASQTQQAHGHMSPVCSPPSSWRKQCGSQLPLSLRIQ